MEKLISLSDLITRQKIHQIELIDETENPKSKIAKLYQGIQRGAIRSDEDAYNFLYNGKKSKNSLARLKNRLFSRLINTIFFIDQSGPQYQDVYQAGKTCYKNHAAARILIANRKRELAVNLVKNSLKISQRYEFTEMNYLFAGFLATHYSLYSIREDRFEKYSLLRRKYLFELESEIEAEEAHGLFSIELTRSSASLSHQAREDNIKKIEELRKGQKTIDTRRYNIFAYLYQTNFYLEDSRYEKVVELAKEAIAFFEQKGIESLDTDTSLRTRAAIASFMLKDYENAEKLFLTNIELSSPRFVNWYNTYNLYFPLCIVQEKYNEAYSILSVVLNANGFDKTHPLLIQLFKIKEAYIHFLIHLEKIDPSESKEEPLRKFRLGRFLNDTPTYSKDKRGVNISILIIQLLLLVQNKKYGELLDKLDALNMYSHRYLRSDNTFRSNCFIKMLMKLPDADYHPVRWERYVKKYRQRLEEHPFELSYHNLDLEVIPFETLYDLVVEMLAKLGK